MLPGRGGSPPSTTPGCRSPARSSSCSLRPRRRCSSGPVAAGAHRDGLRARIVLAAADGMPTPRSPAGWDCDDTVAQVARPVRRPAACPGCRPAPARAAAPVFTASAGPRSRRWPARCRPRPGCRWPGGAARSWPPRRSPAGVVNRSRASTVRPVAGRRRDPPLAVPLLDLSPRSGLRRQGRPGPGPLRPDLGRPAAGRRRVRAQRR